MSAVPAALLRHAVVGLDGRPRLVLRRNGVVYAADLERPGLRGVGTYVFVTRLCGSRLDIRCGRADPVTRQGRLRRYVVTDRGRRYDTLTLGRVWWAFRARRLPCR